MGSRRDAMVEHLEGLVGQRQRVFESVQAVRELFISLCDGFFLASVAFVQKVRDVTEFTSQVFLTST